MQMTSVKKLQKDVSRFTTSQSTYAFLFFCFRQLKKRCGKENEVVKPQAFPPSLFSKRNSNPTRLKTIISQRKMSKNCWIRSDLVLHVRIISKCKEQLIKKTLHRKNSKQKLLFYQWKEVVIVFYQKEKRGDSKQVKTPLHINTRPPLSRRQFIIIFLSRAQQQKKKI